MKKFELDDFDDEYSKKRNFNDEDDSFVNSSLKDINKRGYKLKKNNNEEEELDSEFINLSTLSGKSLFDSGNKNPETSEYLSSVFRGFIFIFMLLISLFAIFLIFKTPYYSYYNQETPIVLDENKTAMSVNPFSQSLEEVESLILDKQDSKIPSAVNTVPNEKNLEEKIETDVKNQKTLNKKDTDLTKLLKNSEPEVVVDQKTTQDIVVNDDTVNSAEDEAPKPSEEQFSYPKKPENINQAPKAQAQKNQVQTQQALKQVDPFKESVADSDNNTVLQDSSSQNVWLVNIFSTTKREEMPSRLIRIKDNYRNVLSGATFYFTENMMPNGINYRISVVQSQSGIAYPNFASQSEAKDFCNKLKSGGLDCFVSSVIKSNLPKFLVR